MDALTPAAGQAGLSRGALEHSAKAGRLERMRHLSAVGGGGDRLGIDQSRNPPP